MNEIKESKELVLFENNGIRRQEYNGEWYYSVVDIIAILINQNNYQTARKYWNKLSQRISIGESSEVVTNCHQLKLIVQDGK